MDHCVANMYVLPMGYLLGGDYTFGQLWTVNIIPVTIGNIIGSQMVSIGYAMRFRRCFWLKKD
eukprot:scaffold682319_cov57-Prasinocladus_malaysianus.AAC.1